MGRPSRRDVRSRARFSPVHAARALCVVLGALGSSAASGTTTAATTTLSLRTRDSRASDAADVYLYTSIDVSSRGASYVTAFEPRAERATVHHMLLYGCKRAAASGLDKVVGGMYEWRASGDVRRRYVASVVVRVGEERAADAHAG